MSTFIVSPPSDSALLTRMVLTLPADLLRLMIGFNSEKMTAVDPTQITIDLGDQSNIATTGPATASDDAAGPEWPRLRKPRAASRNMGALPGHMPRHEELIEMKIATCPCCNLELHHLRKDFSEAHDIVPALARTIRPMYACRSFDLTGRQKRWPARSRHSA